MEAKITCSDQRAFVKAASFNFPGRLLIFLFVKGACEGDIPIAVVSTEEMESLP